MHDPAMHYFKLTLALLYQNKYKYRGNGEIVDQILQFLHFKVMHPFPFKGCSLITLNTATFVYLSFERLAYFLEEIAVL